MHVTSPLLSNRRNSRCKKRDTALIQCSRTKRSFISTMADFSQTTLSTLFSFPVIIVVALAPGLLFALGFALIRSGLYNKRLAKVWRRRISWNTYCMFIIGSILESIALLLFFGILIEDIRFTGTILNVWALVLVVETVLVTLFYLIIFMIGMKKLEKGLREDGRL